MRYSAHYTPVRYNAQTAMKNSISSIGSKIKQRRKTLGWSLDTAAANTGVSKAMLGQIERGESNPTVGTLWKIATGFKISFSSLLGDGRPRSTEVQFSAETETLIVDEDGIEAYTLIPFDPAMGFELMVVSLAPDSIHVSSPHEAGVVEHVIPLTGSVDVCLSDEWSTVPVGDILRFPADQPHSYRNSNDERVTFHNVIRYT